MDNSKIIYKIVFLRKEYKTMNVVKVLKKKTISELLKIGNKTYKLDLSAPTYNKGLNKIYFVDYDSGSQLLFKCIKHELNPKELDMIVSNKIIKELTSGVLDNKKEKILWLIIGFIIGALLASIIVMAIFQGKINTLMESQQNIPLPVPYLPTGG